MGSVCFQPPARKLVLRRVLAGGIAFVTLAAGPSFAQTSVSVYGLIDVGLTYNNRVATSGAGADSRVSIDPGNLQGSRLGFRGTEDLGGGMTALFILENGFSVDTGVLGQGGLLFGRTAVVGLAGNFGRVTFGRQSDFIYTDLSSYNSVVPLANPVLNAHALNLDRSEGSRVNNSIRYNTPNIGGVVASVIYGFGEQAGDNSAGRSFGIGAKYEKGPFGIGLGYFQGKAAAAGGAPISTPSSDAGTACANVRGSAGATCVETFMLSSRYVAGPATLFASWSQVRQPLTAAGGAKRLGGPSNEKIDVLDVGMTYALTGQLKLTTSVIHDRAAFRGSSDGRLAQFNLGLDYYLSKRTDIYTWVANQRTSDMLAPGIYGAPGGADSQTVMQIGIRHTF